MTKVIAQVRSVQLIQYNTVQYVVSLVPSL